MNDDDFIGEQASSNVVNVYRDQERVGHREGLATYIEGGGKLAKMMERRNFFDRELRLVNMIEAYFYEIQSLNDAPNLDRSDLQKIVQLFHSMQHKLYKNPYLIVLAFVMIQTNHQPNCIQRIEQIIRETNQREFTLSDVIRYYRLLLVNPNLRS
jgi:hypothetical protein